MYKFLFKTWNKSYPAVAGYLFSLSVDRLEFKSFFVEFPAG